MAALPNVANVLRVSMFFSIGSKPNQGVRWFLGYTGGPPTVANLEDFGATIKTAADTDFPDVMHESNSITSIKLEDLSSNLGAVAVIDDSTAGALTGIALPSAAAFVTSYEISKRYRGGHPRSYWPLGDAEFLTTDSEWGGSSVTAMTGAVTNVVESINAATEGSTTISQQVAVNYYLGFTSVENPITHRYRNVPTLLVSPNVYAVNSIVGRSYVGSFRKRRPKTS